MKLNANFKRASAAALVIAGGLGMSACADRPLPEGSQITAPIGGTIQRQVLHTGQFVHTVGYYNRYYVMGTQDLLGQMDYAEDLVSAANLVPNGLPLPSKIFRCFMSNIPVPTQAAFNANTGEVQEFRVAARDMAQIRCPGSNQLEGVEYPNQLIHR